MGSSLRIGVIGAGGRGKLVNYAHRPEEGVRVVAAADVRPQPLEEFKQRYGSDVFVTNDYRALLARDDVDAVFVTSPDFLHEEQAVAALEAGKAVYLEKPMAITIEGCDRILATARRTGVKLYLGHNMRHFPMIRAMKKLIDDGAIGEVKAGWCRHFVSYGGDAYFKDWHADRRLSTGLLLQKGAHDLDVLHWLCGGYSQRVSAMGGLTVYGRPEARRTDPTDPGDASWSCNNWPPLSQKDLNPVVDVEDLNQVLMQLDNGVFCSYLQCHFTPDAWRNYTIIGTEGRLENFGDYGGTLRLWNRRTDSYTPVGNQEIEVTKSEGSHGGADTRIVDEFIRYLRDEAEPTTSPIASRYAVATGVQATQSLRNGGALVEVPPIPA